MRRDTSILRLGDRSYQVVQLTNRKRQYIPGLGDLYVRHDYHVVFTTIEDGWTMATVPELPGAVSQGATLEEARANIRETVELLLQSYRENAAKEATK